ncbi:MAG: hypothetical protein JO332_05995 [Planctomycetaceae bacterium]|nr:hypothetical protein [Planctomycetaceae bacterium]
MTDSRPGPQDHDLVDLIEKWKNSPQHTVKVTSYFPAYARLFAPLRGKPCVFIETGILDGGSLFMWRDWLGPQARIIGVDLNPEATKWRDSGFEIHIGDQGDPEFWRKTFAQIGEFDVLLDDGGHQSFQQIVTASEALRAAKKACLVVVEDTGTSFMKDFRAHGRNTFLQYAKETTDLLVGRLFPLSPDRFPSRFNAKSLEEFKDVFSVQFFPGIVAFHVDPARCIPPELVRNRENTTASDFRYHGKNAARVQWPSLIKGGAVTVKGGGDLRTLFGRALKAASDPKHFMERVRRLLSR